MPSIKSENSTQDVAIEWDESDIWVDEQDPDVKHCRRCVVDGVTVTVGDCVCILNADAPGDKQHEKCFIGRVEEIHDNAADDGELSAVVAWYWRPHEIPRRMWKLLPSPGGAGPREVYMNTSRCSLEARTVAVETIFKKCEVVTLP
ncbi:PREDICTED: uncharacterized protein LOC106815327 [Priapulus caudatus]|uniref:Uncharacterized protein LOC106815327 n=1 Tax=Priapulus caudatus TaxID=37621 RepID=A0ABM1EST9_PRICU|nr:PREDICTED: uncharacterized protein LOC106815327 [Priapulus caudatus]